MSLNRDSPFEVISQLYIIVLSALGGGLPSRTRMLHLDGDSDLSGAASIREP